MLNFLLFLMLNITPATAPKPLFVAADSLFNTDGIIFLGNRNGWRFHPGDDLNWANPDFDDSNWMFFKPSGLTEPIPDSLWQGYGWFRFRFAADSLVYEKVTNLYFMTYGAAEVYLDGKLIGKYGTFSTEVLTEKRYMSNYKTDPALLLQTGDIHVLAVRYSYHKSQTYKKLLGKYARTFGFGIGLTNDNYNQIIISDTKYIHQPIYVLGTMFLFIVLMHSSFFIMFPSDRSNLYIAIMAFLMFLQIIIRGSTLFFELDVMQKVLLRDIPYIILFMAAVSMFPFTIGSMFNQTPHKLSRMLIWFFPVFTLVSIILSGPVLNIFVLSVFASCVVLLSSLILIQARRNGQTGVWTVACAFLGLILSTIAFIFYETFSQNFKINTFVLLFFISYISFPLGLIAFMSRRFRDLYIRLEQKVRERTHELNQSLENLKSTQTQLIHSEKLASLGALTAGIAHEIQNPINFVNNFSEVNKELLTELKEEAGKGNLEEVIFIANDIVGNEQKINHYGKRAESIVKGMLLHTRGSSGQKEPTNINNLCNEYLRLSYHGFRAKDNSFSAECETHFDPHLPKVSVVPQDIGRVLLNLINNAFYAVDQRRRTLTGAVALTGFENLSGVEATSDQKERSTVEVKTRHALSPYIPTVTVSTRKNGNGIEISVKDNGPGIPEEIRAKIFQPFFTTKPTGEGTGLGLSLAYDIVKAHGGEITIESIEGEGTEFIITLPCS